MVGTRRAIGVGGSWWVLKAVAQIGDRPSAEWWRECGPLLCIPDLPGRESPAPGSDGFARWAGVSEAGHAQTVAPGSCQTGACPTNNSKPLVRPSETGKRVIGCHLR
jgi:hypothetical protein